MLQIPFRNRLSNFEINLRPFRICLPLALSVYLSKVPDGKADFSVAPGVREALLIMSNGEKIILKEENTINIQVNKQVCIKSKGQDIIYENTETSMTDTAYNTLFTGESPHQRRAAGVARRPARGRRGGGRPLVCVHARASA